MNSIVRSLLLGGAVALLAVRGVAQQEATATIGFASPLSGAFSQQAVGVRNAVQMAVDDLNADQIQIGGKTVRFDLRVADDGGSPFIASQVARQFCESAVVGVVGHLTAETSFAAGKEYAECEMPHVTGMMLGPGHTSASNSMTYNIGSRSELTGAAIGRYGAEALKFKRIAIVTDRSSHGRTVAETFKRSIASSTSSVVGEVALASNSAESIDVLRALRTSNPDGILFAGEAEVAGTLLRQLDASGMGDLKILGTEEVCAPQVWKAALGSRALENLVCGEPGGSLGGRLAADVWGARYEARFGSRPESTWAYAYDAVFVLVNAMKRSDNLDRRRYGRTIGDSAFHGVTGEIAFTPRRELKDPEFTLYTFKGTTKVPYMSVRASLPSVGSQVRVNAIQVITTFFATDRLVRGSAAKIADRFTNERSRAGELSLGIATVSIPPGHRMGEIESPKWRKLEFEPDERKHFVIRSAELIDPRAFFQRVNEVSPAGRKRSFVFVHGYNVSFETAALRTAQLAVDLDIRAVPVFYSWPSQAGYLAYTVDWTNVEWSQPHLRSFLERYADQTKIDEIYVIAHSMGSNAAARAMVELIKSRPDLRGRFKELVLAAPDIDAGVFREQILPIFRDLKAPVTLYASSQDKALRASVTVHGENRAGLGGSRLVVDNGLETIDASNIDTDWLGHSTFAISRPLLTDLALLLKDRMRAQRRPSLATRQLGTATYWEFRP